MLTDLMWGLVEIEEVRMILRILVGATQRTELWLAGMRKPRCIGGWGRRSGVEEVGGEDQVLSLGCPLAIQGGMAH